MKFTARIEMDNAAFADAPTAETARILSSLANALARNAASLEDLADGDVNGTLRDSNGNRVGEWSITA